MLQIALFHSFYGWVIFHCVWIFRLAIVLNLFVCVCQFSGVLPIFVIILLESHLFLKILARIVFFKDLCIWELYYKESWVPKIDTFELWCWRRLLRVPMDCKEIQAVHPKGDKSWVFTGRTDVEAKAPILWPPDAKNWLIGKDPDAGKDWRQEKGMTGDEVIGWHHQLSGHELGQAPGVGARQGGLACCRPRGHKESDVSEWLNWTEGF